MHKTIKLAFKHPLISGVIVIFTGTIFANFFNFLFNLFMSRNLSVVDYGVLAGLISFITLVTIPASALLPTVVHFAASYFAKNEQNMVTGLFFKINKFTFSVGFLILLFIIIFSSSIGTFFNIQDNLLIIVSGLVILLGYIGIANSGILQAKLSFGFLAFTQFTGSFFKLLLGVIFVLIGYSTSGAVWAYVLAYLFSYCITFIPLRYIFRSRKDKGVIPIRDLMTYGMPSAVALISLTLFLTTDLILVKHFFDPESAGIYAGISLLGKIIFFFSAPIGMVMFPIVTRKYTNKESYRNTLVLSLFLVFIPSFCLTIFYFLYPTFIIGVSLRNVDYLQGSSLLGFMAIYMSIYSLLYVLVNFYLSIKRTRVYIPLAIGSLLQIILLWFYHETFFQVVFVSIAVSALLLITLLLYLILYVKKRN
jgi:O-antigen/teichoic acid export membrane protein